MNLLNRHYEQLGRGEFFELFDDEEEGLDIARGGGVEGVAATAFSGAFHEGMVDFDGAELVDVAARLERNGREADVEDLRGHGILSRWDQIAKKCHRIYSIC